MRGVLPELCLYKGVAVFLLFMTCLALFFQYNIFYRFFGNFISCTLVTLTSQSFPHPCDFPPQQKEKKKKEVQFVICVYSLECGQILSGLPFKWNWVLPILHPSQKP